MGAAGNKRGGMKADHLYRPVFGVGMTSSHCVFGSIVSSTLPGFAFRRLETIRIALVTAKLGTSRVSAPRLLQVVVGDEKDLPKEKEKKDLAGHAHGHFLTNNWVRRTAKT